MSVAEAECNAQPPPKLAKILFLRTILVDPFVL